MSLVVIVLLGACGELATFPVAAGSGPQPALPVPHETLIPTVNIAPAAGGPDGLTPTPALGTQVIFVPIADGQQADVAIDVLSGFLSDEGKAYGRPVGVALDWQGALLVADDVGNVVWRVSAASAETSRRR